MALTELQIQEIRSHMLHEEDALKSKFKARKTEFDVIKVLHSEVEDYEKKEYFEVSRSARKVTMNRKKENGRQFEDDIWCMFYRLGFRILNADENLRIQWGPNKEDTQQLDVVAVGQDAIFVVECKASNTFKSHSFKNELYKMEMYKNGVAKALIQIYGKKRVKFIFATRNYRFQEDGEDIQRMKNNHIYHLNDNTYDYINNLIKSYQQSVIYQFHSLMFKDEIISNTQIKIPALKGKMGDKDYYLFSIEPSTLLKIGFVLHRTRVNDSMAPTYQRLLVPSRLKGITKFINEGGYFPNSIIINFAAARDSLKIKFESKIESNTELHDTNAEFGYLQIPNAYGIAYIIDGQHRVYGYSNSDAKDVHTIPVVAFDNMESEEQLRIFMDINENQKAVSPSLRLDLEEDLYWNSGRLDSRMKALRSSIIKSLAASSNNILYNKISIGEDPSLLSFKPFDTALIRSNLIPKATQTQWQGDTDICIYNVKEMDSDKAMKDSRSRITKFINGCYENLDAIMSDDKKATYLFSNRATYAIISLIGSLHTFLIKTNVINPCSSIQERITAIRPYLDHLADGINILNNDDDADLKGALGQGADKFWLCSYENIINKRFPEYQPNELIEWKETQDQELQKNGNDLKNEIRDLLKRVIFSKLEEIYGKKWENNISMLRHECEGRIIKALSDNDNFDLDDYDWKDWLEVTDLKDIIDKNFANDIFAKAVTIDIGNQPFKSKKDKTAWMSLIGQTKEKKPSPITMSIVNKLSLIHDHLKNFLPTEE